MTSVVVTGGSGFLGRWVVGELLARRYEVHVLGRRARADALHGAVVNHRVDLFDRMGTAEVLAQVRAHHMIHLAWETTRGSYWTSPLNAAWSVATVELVKRFWSGGGQRVVIAGSCAEYDWEHLDCHARTCRERATPTRPSTAYGRAKVETYKTLMEHPRARELVWGRLFFPFGPGEAADRLVPSVVHALLDGRPAVVRSGALVRDFLHAREVARAFVELLESEVSGPVNVASGNGATIAAVAGDLAALVGRPELVHVEPMAEAAGTPRRLVADVTRLREEVGYRPRANLRAGLAEAVAHLHSERRV
jgi:nucleoside-diphosphate-sugar epimerase